MFIVKWLISFFFPVDLRGVGPAWKEAWIDKSFRLQTICSLIAIGVVVAFVTPFFNFIQARPGYRLNDWVLNQLQVRDISYCIFLLIYSVVFLTAVNLSARPPLFIKCLQAYTLLLVVRIVCLYFVPLETDKGLIPLVDPFVGKLFYQGSPITKDLFFSGHVSTMFLFSLTMPWRPLKYYFIAATVLVAAFILLQHVHYAVDVAAAPFFALLCYRLVYKRKG
jgi:hypothetical protein